MTPSERAEKILILVGDHGELLCRKRTNWGICDCERVIITEIEEAVEEAKQAAYADLKYTNSALEKMVRIAKAEAYEDAAKIAEDGGTPFWSGSTLCVKAIRARAKELER